MEILKKIISNKKDREFYIACVNDGIKLDRAISLFELSEKYKNLLKNDDIKASDYYIKDANHLDAFNLFSNNIQNSINKNKSKKIMRKIFSKKTSHLITDETYDLFQSFVTNNIAESFFDKYKSKIAAFKTSEQLNNELRKEHKKLSEWSLIKQKEKINNYNTKIVSTDNNSIIFEINDYEACKGLGTDMWCIVREEETFDSYRDDIDRVFYKYDFNVDSTDTTALTAYIVLSDGTIKNGYFSDDEVMPSEEANKNAVYFPKYTKKTFVERLEEKAYSEEYINLMFFKHGLDNEFDKNDILDINISDFISSINGSSISVEKTLKILNSDNINLVNGQDSDVLDTLKSKSLYTFKDDAILLINYLNDVNYYKKNNINLFYHFDMLRDFNIEKDENFELFNNLLNKKGHTVKEELQDLLTVQSEDSLFDPIYQGSFVYKYLKKADDKSFLDVMIETCGKEKALFKLNQQYRDIINVSDPQYIADFVIANQKQYPNFLHTMKYLNESYKVDISSLNLEEEEITSIKDYCIKNPNKIFIKIPSLKRFNIKFDEKTSLNILTKGFFDYADFKTLKVDNENDFLEDFINPTLNDRALDALFKSNHLSIKAKNTFIETVSHLSKDFSEDNKKSINKSIRVYKDLINDGKPQNKLRSQI